MYTGVLRSVSLLATSVGLLPPQGIRCFYTFSASQPQAVTSPGANQLLVHRRRRNWNWFGSVVLFNIFTQYKKRVRWGDISDEIREHLSARLDIRMIKKSFFIVVRNKALRVSVLANLLLRANSVDFTLLALLFFFSFFPTACWLKYSFCCQKNILRLNEYNRSSISKFDYDAR